VSSKLKKQQRTFVQGDSVKIAKKSHVIDREREHENLPEHARVPIEDDVTGIEGKIAGTPYESPAKGGEVCVPIELSSGAVLAVPESRLERVGQSKPAKAGYSSAFAAGWDAAMARAEAERKKKNSRRKR